MVLAMMAHAAAIVGSMVKPVMLKKLAKVIAVETEFVPTESASACLVILVLTVLWNQLLNVKIFATVLVLASTEFVSVPKVFSTHPVRHLKERLFPFMKLHPALNHF
jgi:hypothetical protein